MKKLLILFCCFLFVVTLPAQQIPVKSTTVKPVDDFCSILSDIMKHAPDNFQDINTDKEAAPEDETGEDKDPSVSTISLARKSSLELPGAKANNIVMGLFTPDKYMAYFGTYKIKTEADKKLNSLKTQLTGCLKGYKQTVKPGKVNGTVYAARYLFDEKKTGNTATQHTELVMEKLVIKVKKKPVTIYKVYIYINGLKPMQ